MWWKKNYTDKHNNMERKRGYFVVLFLFDFSSAGLKTPCWLVIDRKSSFFHTDMTPCLILWLKADIRMVTYRLIDSWLWCMAHYLFQRWSCTFPETHHLSGYVCCVYINLRCESPGNGWTLQKRVTWWSKTVQRGSDRENSTCPANVIYFHYILMGLKTFAAWTWCAVDLPSLCLEREHAARENNSQKKWHSICFSTPDESLLCWDLMYIWIWSSTSKIPLLHWLILYGWPLASKHDVFVHLEILLSL